MGATKSEESLNVTKKEIVKTISEEIGMTQLKTKETVSYTHLTLPTILRV